MTHAFRAFVTRACLLGALVLVLAGQSLGGIGVVPAYVEVSLDKGRPSGKFVISNLGDTQERYRLHAIHFVFNKDGALLEKPPDEQSLAAWVTFNPKELTLPPKSKQTVRFAIVPRGKLVPGEYWAAMEMESLNTKTGSGKDAKGREFKIEVIPTILVPIFGTVGTITYEGSLKDVKPAQVKTGTKIQSLVANTGTGRLFVNGTYEIRNKSGQVAATGPAGFAYILPKTERVFVTDLNADIPDGPYTVRLRYKSSKLKSDLVDEKPVDYKRPQPTTQPATAPATNPGPTSRPAEAARTAPK